MLGVRQAASGGPDRLQNSWSEVFIGRLPINGLKIRHSNRVHWLPYISEELRGPVTAVTSCFLGHTNDGNAETDSW